MSLNFLLLILFFIIYFDYYYYFLRIELSHTIKFLRSCVRQSKNMTGDKDSKIMKGGKSDLRYTKNPIWMVQSRIYIYIYTHTRACTHTHKYTQTQRLNQRHFCEDVIRRIFSVFFIIWWWYKEETFIITKIKLLNYLTSLQFDT